MAKKMKFRRHTAFSAVLVAVVLLCGFIASAAEVVDVKSPEEIRAEMSASGLLSEAGRLLKKLSYNKAVPFLQDYLDRMKDSDDKRVHALTQDVRFKLGKIEIQRGSLRAAQAQFEAYMQNKPIYRRREVLKSLAVSYFETKQYKQSISTVLKAFAPPPEVEEEVEKKEDIDELDEEDLGGLTKRQFKRYKREAEEAGEDEFFGDISADKPEEEAEYTLRDKVLLNMTLAESYSGLMTWRESVEPYEFVVENAEKLQRRGYATMKLVTSLSELGEYDRVRELIITLSGTEARYDIRVNMAMLNAASALFNVQEYDSALMLYRMILPRQVLADYHLGKVNELRRSAGMREMQITIETNKAGRVESLLGYKYAESSMKGENPQQALDVEMPPGLVEKEEAVGTLLSLSPYEDDVIYRIGQLYLECGRPWEALAVFDLSAAKDPEGERGQRAFCDALQVLLDPLCLYERLEKRSISFLDDHQEGVLPRQVAYYLTAAYQKQNFFKKIKSLLPYIEGFEYSDNLLARQYEGELYYMQAVADLMLLNYKEAQRSFEYVLEKFPNTQKDNARYWYATTHLFLQDYPVAYEEFENYLADFPEGNRVADAWFQGGICLFGMEKYEQAMERFTYVIETFPASSSYPDACSMRGDLLASKGEIPKALNDYREAIRTAKKVSQSTYATFQMATALELLEKYDEIIELVNDYLERHGDEADVAKAAYWLGKIKLEQGRVDEAIAAYLDTIIQYGDDVNQAGVDMIISELMKTARDLEPEDRTQLKRRLDNALTEAESTTLRLRLRVMLAEMAGTRIELGETLMKELDDLRHAPPPVLAVICDASFERQDYSRAADILEIFLNYFEDSEYMRPAYKLRAYDLLESEQHEQALKIVSDAQALYGVDVDTAWAQILKGRIELAQDRYETALASFKMILTVRLWRGEAYAEACYYMGRTEEQAGHPKKAFAWYQRTYFMYKGHAGGTWAAKAYLASARCLKKLGLDGDRRNTYRAMLYDKYVNTLPQADVAREALGSAEVREISEKVAAGVETNLTVTIESEEH